MDTRLQDRLVNYFLNVHAEVDDPYKALLHSLPFQDGLADYYVSEWAKLAQDDSPLFLRLNKPERGDVSLRRWIAAKWESRRVSLIEAAIFLVGKGPDGSKISLCGPDGSAVRIDVDVTSRILSLELEEVLELHDGVGQAETLIPPALLLWTEGIPSGFFGSIGLGVEIVESINAFLGNHGENRDTISAEKWLAICEETLRGPSD